MVRSVTLTTSSGQVEEEGARPELPLCLSVDLLHHEHVAGAVGLPAALRLLPQLGRDEAKESPVVIVNSTEPAGTRSGY